MAKAVQDGGQTDVGSHPYDYRRMNTYSMNVIKSQSEDESTSKYDKAERPAWIDGPTERVEQIGTTSTTAQVHPYKLTQHLLNEAQSRGCKVELKKAVGIEFDEGRTRVTGVKVEGGDAVNASVVVIAMGPWSGRAIPWFSNGIRTRKDGKDGLNGINMQTRRVHSIVVRPSKEVGADALFLSHVDQKGRLTSPEVYPRPDGTAYINGESDDVPLPDTMAEVSSTPEAQQKLERIGSEVASRLDPTVTHDGQQAETVVSQACYLPHSDDGDPVLGAVGDVEGCYVATGHGVWGILNSLATGLAMSELIVDGKSTSVDLAPFDPKRF
eukprot:GFYU01034049.1.p1 GENE.GFYU01034049.1~~GFYU01034049.1.p1  ORF type:complete len:326 (-),score=86.53 GFYU01034049.1:628-1605(-)